MLRKLYNKTLDFARHPAAIWYLAGISFLESTIFPIPPDVLLIPMVIARRHKAFLYASICTVFSILGACVGYLIGVYFFYNIAEPILIFYDYLDSVEHFKEIYHTYGVWFISGAAVTPFPFKVITIASGFFEIPFLTFLVVSIMGRAMRFFLVSLILFYMGESIEKLLNKYLPWFTTLFFILLVGGYFVIKYIS